MDEYGGELAASMFWRLWFLPLLPRGSVWISSDGGKPMARPIRWHWRSIGAGYLRTWAPLLWMASFIVDTSAGYVFAGVGLLLCAWSWSWRMAHRRRVQLLNDFDLVALGSQCPPEKLLRAEQKELLARKQEELAALAGERSPEEIARFGSAKIDELIAAYAVLRLVAAQTLPSGPWRVAARRIVDGRHDEPAAAEGVFRTAASVERRVTVEQLTDHVRARARTSRAHAVLRLSRLSPSLLQMIVWGRGPIARLLGYGALALAATIGAYQLRDVRDPDQYEIITERRLRDTIATGHTEYRVQCDSLSLFRADPAGGPEVYLCQLGTRVLPVLSEDREGISGTLVRGRLHPRRVFGPSRSAWEYQLRTSPYDDRAAVVYLVTDVFSKLGQIVLALSYLLGAVLLLVLWERVRRQRRQMIEEARLELERAAPSRV